MTWTSSCGSDGGSLIPERLAVGTLLREGADLLRASGSDSARLDAELLLGHVVRADRTALLAAPEAPVGADHARTFRELVARRAKGEPVAYIRGLKEFYGLVLSVDRRALIPRPETELLVDIGVERLRRLLTERPRPEGAAPLVVWDVATGSGAVCVALAVAARRRGYAPEVHFRATDVSADAIALATENAVVHGVADAISFGVSDLADLAASPEPPSTSPADLLLANLPYIPSGVVPTLPVAASYEPVIALDGGPDGLDLVRRLIGQLDGAVRAGGVALLEIGAGQAETLRAAASKALPNWEVAFHADLGGLPRVLELSRQGPRVTRTIPAGAPGAIADAADALRRGELIAIPTETVYGLAVLPDDEPLNRLLAAKHRSAEKGIQLLIDSVEQAEGMALLTDGARRLAAKFWPGGLTIVLRRRSDALVPDRLGGGRPTLGLRLPDHEVPRALARVLGPIAASSANISGEPDATTALRVAQSFGEEVALILDDGPVRGGTPSTVVDCSDPDVRPAILREGAISARDIDAALDQGPP